MTIRNWQTYTPAQLIQMRAKWETSPDYMPLGIGPGVMCWGIPLKSDYQHMPAWYRATHEPNAR